MKNYRTGKIRKYAYSLKCAFIHSYHTDHEFLTGFVTLKLGMFFSWTVQKSFYTPNKQEDHFNLGAFPVLLLKLIKE